MLVLVSFSKQQEQLGVQKNRIFNLEGCKRCALSQFGSYLATLERNAYARGLAHGGRGNEHSLN